MIFHLCVTVTKFYMWLLKYWKKTVALSLQNLYAFIQGSTSFSYLEKCSVDYLSVYKKHKVWYRSQESDTNGLYYV